MFSILLPFLPELVAELVVDPLSEKSFFGRIWALAKSGNEKRSWHLKDAGTSIILQPDKDSF